MVLMSMKPSIKIQGSGVQALGRGQYGHIVKNGISLGNLLLPYTFDENEMHDYDVHEAPPSKL